MRCEFNWIIMAEFNLDKQEYQSVFKVFDKDNQGEISVGQVYELLQKFEEQSPKQEAQKQQRPNKSPSKKGTTIQIKPSQIENKSPRFV